MNTFRSKEAEILGQELAEIRRELEMLKADKQQAQLGYSSIENRSVKAYDAQGQLRQQIGRQPDGAFAVKYSNGKQPPTPTDPLVTPAQLALVVYWDGTFAGNAKKPTDFVRCDVHIAPDEDTTDGEFTVGPTTLYGSLLTESAVTIPLDSSEYWVKLVAVTNSDVASESTASVQGNPAAASEIAAEAIGAEQLASTLVLASRIIAGNPTAQHWEIDTQGIRGYDNDGNLTIFQQPDTGDITFRGTLETAQSGQRIVINDPGEGAESDDRQVINFYGPGGAEKAQITSAPFYDSQSVGLSFKSSPANEGAGDDSQALIQARPTYIFEGLQKTSSGNWISASRHLPGYSEFYSPEIRMTVTKGGPNDPDIINGVRFQALQWNGSSYQYQSSTPIEMTESQADPDGVFMINWPGRDVGLVGNDGDGTGKVYAVAVGDPGGAYRNLVCATLEERSSITAKNSVEALQYSALHSVLSAETKSWKRNEEGSGGPTHYGLIAEEIPEDLVVEAYDPDGTYAPRLSNTNMIGILWEAVRELAHDRGIELDETKLPPKERNKRGK